MTAVFGQRYWSSGGKGRQFFKWPVVRRTGCLSLRQLLFSSNYKYLNYICKEIWIFRMANSERAQCSDAIPAMDRRTYALNPHLNVYNGPEKGEQFKDSAELFYFFLFLHSLCPNSDTFFRYFFSWCADQYKEMSNH